VLAGVVLWPANFPEKALPKQIEPSVAYTLVLVYLPMILTLYLSSRYVLRSYKIDKARHGRNVVIASGS